MSPYKKAYLLLLILGVASLGGCEVYETPAPYQGSYYYQNMAYSPVLYEPYPYYSYYPYYPYYHHRHHQWY